MGMTDALRSGRLEFGPDRLGGWIFDPRLTCAESDARLDEFLDGVLEAGQIRPGDLVHGHLGACRDCARAYVTALRFTTASRVGALQDALVADLPRPGGLEGVR